MHYSLGLSKLHLISKSAAHIPFNDMLIAKETQFPQLRSLRLGKCLGLHNRAAISVALAFMFSCLLCPVLSQSAELAEQLSLGNMRCASEHAYMCRAKCFLLAYRFKAPGKHSLYKVYTKCILV